MTRPPSTDHDRSRHRRRSGTLPWPFWLGLLLLAAASAWFMLQLGGDTGGGPAVLEVQDEVETSETTAGDRAPTTTVRPGSSS